MLMLVVYAQLAPTVTMKEQKYQLLVTLATSVLKAQPSLCPVLVALTTALPACMTQEAARPATLAITAHSSARFRSTPLSICVTQAITVLQVQADLSPRT